MEWRKVEDSTFLVLLHCSSLSAVYAKLRHIDPETKDNIVKQVNLRSSALFIGRIQI